MEYDRVSLEDWQKQQPLSVLQLDTADRVVLRVAGKMLLHLHFHEKNFHDTIKITWSTAFCGEMVDVILTLNRILTLMMILVIWCLN